ncbi:hypothetical protein LCGC14_2459270, partial [marine sediment metagenome]
MTNGRDCDGDVPELVDGTNDAPCSFVYKFQSYDCWDGTPSGISARRGRAATWRDAIDDFEQERDALRGLCAQWGNLSAADRKEALVYRRANNGRRLYALMQFIDEAGQYNNRIPVPPPRLRTVKGEYGMTTSIEPDETDKRALDCHQDTKCTCNQPLYDCFYGEAKWALGACFDADHGGDAEICASESVRALARLLETRLQRMSDDDDDDDVPTSWSMPLNAHGHTLVYGDDEMSEVARVQRLVHAGTRRRLLDAPERRADLQLWEWLSFADKRKQLISHRVQQAMRLHDDAIRNPPWAGFAEEEIRDAGGTVDKLRDRKRQKAEEEVDQWLKPEHIFLAKSMQDLDDHLIVKAVLDAQDWAAKWRS